MLGYLIDYACTVIIATLFIELKNDESATNYFFLHFPRGMKSSNKGSRLIQES